MARGDAYHLHGYGAAAAAYATGLYILPDGPRERQKIYAGMMFKTLILKSNNALFEFFGHYGIIREPPLPIGCYSRA